MSCSGVSPLQFSVPRPAGVICPMSSVSLCYAVQYRPPGDDSHLRDVLCVHGTGRWEGVHSPVVEFLPAAQCSHPLIIVPTVTSVGCYEGESFFVVNSTHGVTLSWINADVCEQYGLEQLVFQKM